MRIIRRASKDDHEEESVFVPMTDMTVSFLFIVMILLAFFAVQFSDEDNVPRLLYEKVLEERNEFERDIKTLEAKITELNQTIDDLKLENEFLERENSRLIDENKQLETRIEEAKREIADLNNELELLEKKLKKFMQSVFNLSKELARLKIDLSEANKQIALKDADLLRLRQSIHELRTIKINLERNEANLKKRVNEVLDRLVNTLTLNQTQKELLEIKDQQLADFEIQVQEKNEIIDGLLLKIRALEEKLKEQSPLEIYMAAAKNQREKILNEIKSKLELEFENILVEISPESDALRFKGDGLFAVNSSTLRKRERVVVERLGSLITDAIACYTRNQRVRNYSVCNPEGIIVEAVQIEGHTDSDGGDFKNLRLSTDRANSAFIAMQSKNEDLLSFLNFRKQPVISVAGYGEMRPVASNKTVLGRSENRRIDIRLIMYAPVDSTGVLDIKREITQNFIELNKEKR